MPLPPPPPRPPLLCCAGDASSRTPTSAAVSAPATGITPPPPSSFFEDFAGYTFRSVMDPPDLIPAVRFSPPLRDDKGSCEPSKWRIFGCRHGRVLLYNQTQKEIVLWDPSSGDNRRIAVLPEFHNEEKTILNGAVLCAAAGDRNHVHGSFCSCPFKVAVVGVTSDHTQLFASIYSTETGKWSDLVSTTVPFVVYTVTHPGTLVGNSLYWMPLGNGCSRIVLTEDGGLGLANLSHHTLQMWERKVCFEGIAKWVLRS